MRPLLERVDEQNHQIAKQMEELKAAEAVRREFSANVSHELKTPLDVDFGICGADDERNGSGE